MSRDERSNIENILDEVYSKAATPQRDTIDDDVNAILESLGMPSKPKPGVLSPQSTPRPAGAPKAPAAAQRQMAPMPMPMPQKAPAAQTAMPMPQKAPAPQAAPQKPQRPAQPQPSAARIVNTAPLAAPVVQNHTETLELPDLNRYREMQARRVAEIERVAAERALERAAERQRQSRYDVPGMKPRKDVLGVEVDDRFRAFFAKTVIDDGSGAPLEETAELEVPRRRRKAARGKGGRLKSVFGRDAEEQPQEDAYAEDGGADTDYGTYPQEDYAAPEPTGGAHSASDGMPPMLEMTGNVDVRGAQQPPAQQPAQQDHMTARARPAPMQWPAMPQKPTKSAAPGVARAGDFTESITPAAAPSDTFMMNHVDERAQERYEQEQPPVEQGAAPVQDAYDQSAYEQNAYAQGDYAQGDYAQDGFDDNAFYDMAPMQDDALQAYDEEPQQPSGTTYREFTITMPLGRTTSTIGIDPDRYGVPDADYEEEADYNHLSDAPDVASALRGMRLTRLLRVCVTALLAGVLVYMGLAARNTALPFADAASPQTQPLIFLILNLVLLAVAGIVCMGTLGAGLGGLFGRPSADSMTALAVLGAMAQLVGYVISVKDYTPTTITLFAPVAAVLLCANSVGKWLHAKSVSDSFDVASAGEDHAAAFIVPNRDLTKMVCMGLNEPDPLLLVSRPTALVRGFMRQSFSSHISDVYGRKLSLILFMCATVCGVITGLRADSVLAGISAASAALCLGAPLSATLVYAVPAYLLQRAAARVGAVVPGSSAVKKLGLCNTVLLHSQHLFPASSVRLHGIKPFAKQRIDLAILYAASMVYENCDTLRDTFMALIDGKRNLLYKVDSPQAESGCGYSGWIQGHEVLFGNRAMMQRHNIQLPSGDYERKFSKNGTRCVMYLAVGGRAFSMYVISYQPDAEAQEVLNSLSESGISVVLQSDDFNITERLVASTYHVSPALLKVLTQTETEMLSGQTDYLPESDGYMTHRGTCGSFVGGLRAAATAARREYLADMVQMACVLFTMLMAVLLSVFMALPELALTVVLLYQLAWGVITVLPAIFKQ